jgi:hypothetical protein
VTVDTDELKDPGNAVTEVTHEATNEIDAVTLSPELVV